MRLPALSSAVGTSVATGGASSRGLEKSFLLACQAVRAEPDVVSPNVLEAEELVGHEFAGEEERSLAVAEIAALGPREAIMTLPDGCAMQTRSHERPPAPFGLSRDSLRHKMARRAVAYEASEGWWAM